MEPELTYLGTITDNGIQEVVVSSAPVSINPYYRSMGRSNSKMPVLGDEAQFACDMSFTTGYNLGQKDMQKLKIEKVAFNGPATIVWWSDGDKTVVKDECYKRHLSEIENCQGSTKENMDYDWKYNGIVNAIAKKMLPNYMNQIDKFIGYEF